MKSISLAVIVALTLSSSGCARALRALVAGAQYVGANSSAPPPPPPKPQPATVTAQFVREVSTGGTTKQCVYSYAGNTHVTTVSITEYCPSTIQVPAW